MPIMPGTEIRYGEQWWKVDMVGITGGERYYWLSRDNGVLMVPAFMIEIPAIDDKRAERKGDEPLDIPKFLRRFDD